MQLLFDEFIRKEKSRRPSDPLTERIMEAVAGTEVQPVRNPSFEGRIQVLVLAASVALALIVGIALGKSYQAPEAAVWNIDDNRLENLVLYEEFGE